MDKHTPGPWRLTAGTGGLSAVAGAEGVEVAIATLWWGPAEAEANARLIAEAPELLETLESLVPHVQWHADECRCGDECRAVGRARAAIARARGAAPAGEAQRREGWRQGAEAMRRAASMRAAESSCLSCSMAHGVEMEIDAMPIPEPEETR